MQAYLKDHYPSGVTTVCRSLPICVTYVVFGVVRYMARHLGIVLN